MKPRISSAGVGLPFPTAAFFTLNCECYQAVLSEAEDGAFLLLPRLATARKFPPPSCSNFWDPFSLWNPRPKAFTIAFRAPWN